MRVAPQLTGRILVLLLAACLVPTPARAAWQANGIPVAPIGTGTAQSLSSVCPDGANGAYIAWKQYTSGDPGNAYLQRVNAEGNIPGGWPATGLPLAVAVNTQNVCNLAPDMFGGAFVVWRTDFPTTLEYRLQRILANGTIAPGWPSNGVDLPAGSDYDAMDDLCGDAHGGVYVVWTSSDDRVYMLHFGADGQVAPGWSAVGRPIITEISTKGTARIIPAADGGFLASWNDERGGPGVGTTRYALRILPSGDPAPGWPPGGVRANSIPTAIENVFMISDGAGGAYLGWNDNRNGVFPPSPLDYEIYGQHILGDGTVDPRWPADGLPIVIAPSAQYFFKMTEDGFGGAIFVWDDYRAGARIYAVRIRPDGSVAPGWTVNGSPMAPHPTGQTIPEAVPDGVGGVYGFWDETQVNPLVVGQHLDAGGAPAPGWSSAGRIIAGGDATYDSPIATSDGKGGAIVAYVRRVAIPVFSTLVYAQRVMADGPVPTRIAFLDAETAPGFAHLRWTVSDAASARATVYRRRSDEPWVERGVPTIVGESVLEFEDRDLVPGRYAYRLGVSEAGIESFTEETWLDVPSAFSLHLAGFRPNPAVGSPILTFSLPDEQAARLDVFDVKGRVVTSRDVGGLGAGVHVMPLSQALSAGMYWIRLSHPDRTLTTKGLVAH